MAEDNVFEIIWVDLSKMGRVCNNFLNAMADVLQVLLRHSRVCSVVIAPLLASAGVLHGSRGELRRIEDKLDAKALSASAINLRVQPCS